ncbi:hypothetical protein AAMO2058_001212000 [Amorphochlora amoebiformis]
MPSGSGRPWGRLRLHKDGSKKPMDQTTELSKAKAFIGRKRSCDVVAKTKTVSGVHCAIHRVDMPKGDYKAVIQNISRKNPVFINYTKLDKGQGPHVLEHQDKIVFAKTELIYVFEYTQLADKPQTHSAKRAKKQRTTTLRPGDLLKTGGEGKKSESVWEVLDLIGQGTFSEIYRARCKGTEKLCAVKVDKRGINKNVLVREIHILKVLQEKKGYVCKFLGQGTLPNDPNGMFILMELCQQNVSEYRKKQEQKKFQQYEGGYLGLEMLRALRAVHEMGYIHRDIKPSNFMIPLDKAGKRFACYIVDFGLSKQHIKDGTVAKPRERGEFRGTSLYASVFTHQHQELGRRDDLWSLLVPLGLRLRCFRAKITVRITVLPSAL